ncbi:MAG: 1-acyl-sn-glycerol-3-phosphate acyltransferase [Chloroflexi bacterium]|nr:MAG: 1-acyl-sn-glycerol-3-phosphate acyltransferase [Chloroflexota bacterium]
MLFRYRFIRFWMHILRLLLLVRIEVTGRENIPAKGPYLVTVNHMSVVDTPVLLLAFPVMRWRFFAGEKWRTHPIYGPIMGWLGAVYINRGQPDRRALREALDALKSGSVFGLAPEGTRSKVGYMQPAREGAAYLASRANVPILPVGIENTDRLFANALRLRPTKVVVHVGRPFSLPELSHRPKGAELEALTHYIMVHIAAQLPERYHGVYKESPALRALLAGEDPWPACLALVGLNAAT